MGIAVETVRIVVLDPTVGPEAGGLAYAARVQDLRDKVAGLLDNGKPKADRFLERVGRGLKDRYGVKDVVLVRKADASAAAEPAILSDLAKRCHFVVAGVGDWGSCSAGSVLDGVEMERAGIPAAAVITDEFGPTAQAMLENQGAPWFRFIEVKHPINILGEAELASLADGVVDEIARLVSGEP